MIKSKNQIIKHFNSLLKVIKPGKYFLHVYTSYQHIFIFSICFLYIYLNCYIFKNILNIFLHLNKSSNFSDTFSRPLTKYNGGIHYTLLMRVSKHTSTRCHCAIRKGLGESQLIFLAAYSR